MASIQKRRTKAGNTMWAVLYRLDGRQTSTTYPNERAAKDFLTKVNALGPVEAQKYRAPEPGTDQTLTVQAHVNAYVNSLSGITEGTRSDYRSYAKRDLGILADLPVDMLTREVVARWVNELSERLSGKSIMNRKSLLSAALTQAQREGIVPANHAKGVRVPRSIRRDMTFLTHGEFAQLLGAFPKFWQPLVVTLVGTGMRWGEATALAVRDVDLDSDAPVVRVRQAYKHTDGNGRELGAPKTRKGRRTIEISPEVRDAIRPLLEGKKADDLVFLNTHGRPITQSTFLVHVWRPAIKKSGIVKTPRVHDLRHTHASWLIAANVPLTYIQVRLGHESIATTSDVYGHLAPDAGRISAAVTSLALAQSFPSVEGDDDRPPSPAALAVASLEPDVEGFDDAASVGEQ